MAKKKYILSESAVRRMQKLAMVKPITEMYGMKYEEPMEKPMEEAYDDVMEEEEEEVAMDAAELPMEEPPMDMPEPEMDAPAGGDAEEMARNVIMAVADALGVEIDIDGGEEEAPEMEMEPEMEPEEEVMQEEAIEEETLEEVEVIDEDALTEAVMKRVLGRLKEMTSKSKK